MTMLQGHKLIFIKQEQIMNMLKKKCIRHNLPKTINTTPNSISDTIETHIVYKAMLAILKGLHWNPIE